MPLPDALLTIRSGPATARLMRTRTRALPSQPRLVADVWIFPAAVTCGLATVTRHAGCGTVAAWAVATGAPRVARLTTHASTPRGLRIWVSSVWMDGGWAFRILSVPGTLCREISDIQGGRG